jgi:hypothetical protein
MKLVRNPLIVIVIVHKTETSQNRKTDFNPPTNQERHKPDKMKTNFAYYCSQSTNETLRAYLNTLPLHLLHRRRVTYDQFIWFTMEHHRTPNEEITRLLDALREEFEKPPPTQLTIAERNVIILRELQRFDENPTTFEDQRIDLNFDGWKGYIRKIYLPKPQVPVSQKDVEYHIHLDNYDECKLKTQYRSWGAFIYINERDHLCNGQYKSIQGTHFGVQHSKFF